MFCAKCGKKLPPDAGFCPGCGTPTGEPVPQRTPAPGGGSDRSSVGTAVGKNAAYYLTEFQKIEVGEKFRFNWAALLLGPAMCFYRKCGGLFRKYFLLPLILFLVGYLLSAIGTGIIEPVPMLAGTVLSIVSGLWLLIADIRFGLKFNREYCAVCKQKMSSSVGEKSLGVTLKSLILFLAAWVAAVAICMGIATVVVNSFWGAALSDIDFDSNDQDEDYSLTQDGSLSNEELPPTENYEQEPGAASSYSNDQEDNDSLNTVTGRFDNFVGSWQDENGSGFMIMIGYRDETKQQAYAYIATAAGDFEVELKTDDGLSASGADTGVGSEPIYALDIVRNNYWLEAYIYYADPDISYDLKFVPADPAEYPYENPYYTG
ncbi:zinc ribbon domain-containing protein [Pseudoflavonifractor phocaeensis]|uniref:zinc ribbon domain-containing protein n=1 Tax=Pseudoflavonifractor phocaeensis TaxID=1870988 RepID=UPI00195B30B6|nr:zinc ribbon domain-containing protein [Pseudoflavonifractor phocaeensis]MBM6926882.1 zinc ribbon domain-containing protein [Pseudoflavonifractor phocaeensis]